MRRTQWIVAAVLVLVLAVVVWQKELRTFFQGYLVAQYNNCYVCKPDNTDGLCTYEPPIGTPMAVQCASAGITVLNDAKNSCSNTCYPSCGAKDGNGNVMILSACYTMQTGNKMAVGSQCMNGMEMPCYNTVDWPTGKEECSTVAPFGSLCADDLYCINSATNKLAAPKTEIGVCRQACGSVTMSCSNAGYCPDGGTCMFKNPGVTGSECVCSGGTCPTPSTPLCTDVKDSKIPIYCIPAGGSCSNPPKVSCKEFGAATSCTDAQPACCDGTTCNSSGKCEQPAKCGNGFTDASEQCDDGNTTNNDGCSTSCKNEICGDGIQQTNEECDAGANNVDVNTAIAGATTYVDLTPAQVTEMQKSGCLTTCKKAACSNTIDDDSDSDTDLADKGCWKDATYLPGRNSETCTVCELMNLADGQEAVEQGAGGVAMKSINLPASLLIAAVGDDCSTNADSKDGRGQNDPPGQYICDEKEWCRPIGPWGVDENNGVHLNKGFKCKTCVPYSGVCGSVYDCCDGVVYGGSDLCIFYNGSTIGHCGSRPNKPPKCNVKNNPGAPQGGGPSGGGGTSVPTGGATGAAAGGTTGGTTGGQSDGGRGDVVLSRSSVNSSSLSSLSSSANSSSSSSSKSSSLFSSTSLSSSFSSTLCGDKKVEGVEQCDNGSACKKNRYVSCLTAADCKLCMVVAGQKRCEGIIDGKACITSADCEEIEDECVYKTDTDLTCTSQCMRVVSSSSSSLFSQSSSLSSSAASSVSSSVSSSKLSSSSIGSSTVSSSSSAVSSSRFTSSFAVLAAFKSASSSSSFSGQSSKELFGNAGYCGDGAKESFEACDDGNRNNGDGCSSDCQTDETLLAAGYCGNGTKEEFEQCDDGNTKKGDGCSADCTEEEKLVGVGYCGNGTKEEYEECDDGNFRDGDGCSSSCLQEKKITIVTQALEQQPVAIVEKPAAPPPALVAAASLCGNGLLETPEECDDTNKRAGDGCNESCLLEVGLCGDGKVQALLGEQCEQSTHNPALPYQCQDCHFFSLSCGNGAVDLGEECDNGKRNSLSPDADCRPDCSLSRCGDSVLDSTELCDDGNRRSGDGCDAYCRTETTFVVSDTTVESKNQKTNINNSITNNPFTVPFPYAQPYPQYQLPFATLQPLMQQMPTTTQSGPAAVFAIAAGASAGFAWVRKKRKR